MSLIKTIRSVFALFAPHKNKKKRRAKRASRKRPAAALKNPSKPARKKKNPSASKKKKKKTRPAKQPKAKPAPAVRTLPKSRRAAGLKPKKAAPKRTMVGEVTHYFDRAKAGAFMITGAPVAVGDLLEFEGKKTSFRQKVVSLQINRVPVSSAQAGDEVGLLVKKPVREGDYVFKI